MVSVFGLTVINAQKNDLKIGIYKGSPSVYDLESHFFGDRESDEQEKNTLTTGASGIKINYFLSNRIAIGVNVSYSLSQYSTFIKNNDVKNSINVNEIPMNYSHIVSYQYFGIIPEFSYHFKLGKRLQSNFLLGVGYRNVKKNEQSTFLKDEAPWINYNDDYLMSPIIGRVSWGLDFNISNLWSISSELGVGGGYVASIGVNYCLIKKE